MSDRQQQLQQNVQAIRSRIADAAARAHRRADSVTLVAVTKYVDDAVVRDLASAGCTELGESRPQALWSKAEALGDLNIRWHLIGHLQRNKLKRTLPHCHLIHSVDSLRLLDAIDDMQQQLDPEVPQPVLLEVNISGDEAKHGFSESSIHEALERADSLRHIHLQGVMGMAGWGTSPEEARRDFEKLRLLHERLVERYPEIPLPERSMGMSGDFEQAILEGATLVRVGSALFDQV